MAAAVANHAPAAGDQHAEGDVQMADAPTVTNPRRFKASELPLTSATRTAIDGLAHAFKKKGGYDATRKLVWDTFEASVRAEQDYIHFKGCAMTIQFADANVCRRISGSRSRKQCLKSPRRRSNETQLNC